MKKESALKIIWKIIYPLLIFVGVEIVIEVIVSGIASAYGVSNGLASADDPEELSHWITDTVSQYMIFISMARCVILIPLMFFLFKKDIANDKANGVYTEYTDYSKKWLLVLPLLAFALAMAFNHLVPLLAEGVQNLLNKIGFAWFGRHWNIDFIASYNSKSSSVYSNNLWIQLVSAGILAPVAEELIHRGIIYERLKKYISITGAMVISTAFFAAMHGNFIQIVYTFIIGLVFAYVYERFKCLWAPVILHCGANISAILVTYFVGDKGIAVGLGSFALIVVAELAIVFLLLLLITKNVKRMPADIKNN